MSGSPEFGKRIFLDMQEVAERTRHSAVEAAETAEAMVRQPVSLPAGVATAGVAPNPVQDEILRRIDELAAAQRQAQVIVATQGPAASTAPVVIRDAPRSGADTVWRGVGKVVAYGAVIGTVLLGVRAYNEGQPDGQGGATPTTQLSGDPLGPGAGGGGGGRVIQSLTGAETAAESPVFTPDIFRSSVSVAEVDIEGGSNPDGSSNPEGFAFEDQETIFTLQFQGSDTAPNTACGTVNGAVYYVSARNGIGPLGPQAVAGVIAGMTPEEKIRTFSAVFNAADIESQTAMVAASRVKFFDATGEILLLNIGCEVPEDEQ